MGWHFLPAAAINKWMHDATDMDWLRPYAANRQRIIIDKVYY
jgi:hypothetical protein